MNKITSVVSLLLALTLPNVHGFQFIENWLCPKVNGTLLPRTSERLKDQAFLRSRHFNQQPLVLTETPVASTKQDPNSVCNSISSFSALGDSYSAGLGAKQRLGICGSSSENPGSITCTLTDCGKNTGSYSYLFAQQYNIPNFQYLPCSGANTSEVLQNQVDSKYFYGSDGKAPDVVSFTVGGDDYGLFIDLVKTCVLGLRPENTTCADWIQTSKDKAPAIAANLQTLFQGLQARIGSNTKVVVMGYPLPFGSQQTLNSQDGAFCPPEPDNASDRQGINDVVTELNSIISQYAENAGFIYADVSPSWASHRWCDTGSAWFDQMLCDREVDTAGEEYFNIAFAHPTIEGQTAYLQTLMSALGC